MKKYFLGIALLTLLFAVLHAQSKETSAKSPRLESQTAFFNKLRKMCGQRFEGATDFPQNADHPMVGKKLLMSVGPCGKKEIRIPFQVGDDKSRTWILTLGAKGLLFKHDHRHPDGTPDKITMYGGWAAANGTRYLQRFPADPDTVKLIPEAATNVWTLQIIPEKQQFIYYLERNSQPRYRAVFSLKPLAQQNPKASAFTGLYTQIITPLPIPTVGSGWPVMNANPWGMRFAEHRASFIEAVSISSKGTEGEICQQHKQHSQELPRKQVKMAVCNRLPGETPRKRC